MLVVSALVETQLENNRLVADLREAREILREASLKAAESLSHGKSHGEVSIEEEVKESNGHEVDIYFFHFHMLGMFEKCYLTKYGSPRHVHNVSSGLTFAFVNCL